MPVGLRGIFLTAFIIILGGKGLIYAINMVPGYQLLELMPGEKSTIEVRITNSDQDELKVIPNVKEWVVYPQNKGIKVGDWLKTTEPSLVLKRGESKAFVFEIHAPMEATGELMAMTTFLSQLFGEDGNIQQRVSGAVYLTIQGTDEYKGIIQEVMVDQSRGYLRVGARIENVGNVHMRPRGSIKIFKKKKNVVADIVIKPGRPIHPGKTRTFFGELRETKLESGHYYVQVFLDDYDRPIDIVTEKKKFELKENEKVIVK